jgi:hypothetical protein
LCFRQKAESKASQALEAWTEFAGETKEVEMIRHSPDARLKELEHELWVLQEQLERAGTALQRRIVRDAIARAQREYRSLPQGAAFEVAEPASITHRGWNTPAQKGQGIARVLDSRRHIVYIISRVELVSRAVIHSPAGAPVSLARLPFREQGAQRRKVRVLDLLIDGERSLRVGDRLRVVAQFV